MTLQAVLLQALQVSTVNNNGFISDPIGEVRLFDHYHRFLFFINTTQFEVTFSYLMDNKNLIRNRSINDILTLNLFGQFENNCKEIELLLQKLNYKMKRALANILGKAVKFVTGNLDEDDLTNINENLDKLYKNQKSEFEKINKLITFANHLSQRYANDMHTLTRNLETSKAYLLKVKDESDTRTMLTHQIYYSNELKRKLLLLERCISLAWREIPDLELFTHNELSKIVNYLHSNYDSDQLLPLKNQHLYEIIKLSKIYVFGTDKAITFLLKIPIIKPFSGRYSQVYPIPNNQNIIIIPPKKFIIEADEIEYWTNENCQNATTVAICYQQPIQDVCSLRMPRACLTTKSKNNYNIVQMLRNHQLLTLFKENQLIIEDCHGHLKQKYLKGINIVHSQCKIIINKNTYDYTAPLYQIEMTNITTESLVYNKEINLASRHLANPEDLLKEAEDLQDSPLHLNLLTHAFHYGITGFMTFSILVILIVGIKFRKRLQDLFCKPRRIIRVENVGKHQEVVDIPNLDEDVQT